MCVQFQMQSFSLIVMASLWLWQVQVYCFHHQFKISAPPCLWFVGTAPEILNKFDQQNSIQVTVCWDDKSEILELSVVG